jgi:hypothetical protein
MSRGFDKERRRDMTDRTSTGKRNTDPLPEGIQEHIMFAVPCLGKKKHVAWCVVWYDAYHPGPVDHYSPSFRKYPS